MAGYHKPEFSDLFYRVDVTFSDKTLPNDSGFTMELSEKMNYDQMAQAVAQRLGTDPDLLQFFRFQSYRDGPGNLVRYTGTFEGTLEDLFFLFKPTQPNKIYYQQLKQFKCMWVNSKLKKEKELVLYPIKNGCVADLLEEGKKQVELAENGSGKLRLLEVIGYKIFCVQRVDVQLKCLNSAGTKSYRIEEIPKDELHTNEDELLVPVAHFHREVYTTFGVPFLFKIKNGEQFSWIKERLQKKLEVPDEEFEKYKFAIIYMANSKYIQEEDDYVINTNDFLPRPLRGTNWNPRPWIGLEHVHKALKRSR